MTPVPTTVSFVAKRAQGVGVGTGEGVTTSSSDGKFTTIYYEDCMHSVYVFLDYSYFSTVMFPLHESTKVAGCWLSNESVYLFQNSCQILLEMMLI